VSGVSVVEIKNGKISRVRDYYNFAAMTAQLRGDGKK
jgi:hypothetical protein